MSKFGTGKYCFQGLTGDVITPRTPMYNELRQEWNRSIQKFPLVLVYCSNKQDVIHAICWARKNHVDIRIRSGGHNYEGYSVGNDVIVIDVSRMNQLILDEEIGVVIAEGGVKNTQMYDFLCRRSYPFPGGTCPTVGVSGFTLGGGWGLSSRLFGLGIDSLLEIEIINYEGKRIIANADKNSDLFWACKGAGGGNFGVIVSLTYKLPTKIPTATLIDIAYLGTTEELQVQVMDTVQSVLPNLDRRMNFRCSFYQAKGEGLGIFLSGLFYGSSSEARTLVQPFTSIGRTQVTIETLPLLTAMQRIQAVYPDYEKFKSGGRFADRYYTEQELYKLVRLISSPPKGSIYAAVTFYGLGGAVSDVENRATAYYYRKSPFIIGLQSVWEEDKYGVTNKQWMNTKFPKLSHLTKGSFINFPFSPQPCFLEEYFGGNAMKLRKVKEKYDPCNVFTFPQGIKEYQKRTYS